MIGEAVAQIWSETDNDIWYMFKSKKSLLFTKVRCYKQNFLGTPGGNLSIITSQKSYFNHLSGAALNLFCMLLSPDTQIRFLMSFGVWQSQTFESESENRAGKEFRLFTDRTGEVLFTAKLHMWCLTQFNPNKFKLQTYIFTLSVFYWQSIHNLLRPGVHIRVHHNLGYIVTLVNPAQL